MVSDSPNSRRRDSPCSSRGPTPHAEPEPEEDGAEEHAVAGVAAAEVGDEGAGQADHDAAGRERPDDADHEAAYDGGGGDVLPAVDHHGPHRVLGVHVGRAARDVLEGRDHDAGDDEGDAVDVEREVDRAAVEPLEEVAVELVHQGQPGEQRRRRQRRAVGRGEADLVGRLEPVPRHQVGHRGVLGRPPHQRDHLDQHGDHEDPPQLPDDRDRQEERAADVVAPDQRDPAVELVGDVARDRAHHQRRQHAQEEHGRDGVVLAGVGVRAGVRHRGQGEQADPVAQARQAQADPEPAEVGDPQHGRQRVRRRVAQVVDRRGVVLFPHGPTLGVAGVRTVRTPTLLTTSWPSWRWPSWWSSSPSSSRPSWCSSWPPSSPGPWRAARRAARPPARS